MPDSSIWGDCFASVATGGSVDYVATLSCLPYFIKNIVDMAIAFSGAVAVFFIVWGGIQYIRSGGDPKQAEGARHTITYAIIGLIVVLMAYFILSIVAQLTGADCIRMLGFTNCQSATTAPAADNLTDDDCGGSGQPGCDVGTIRPIYQCDDQTTRTGPNDSC